MSAINCIENIYIGQLNKNIGVYFPLDSNKNISYITELAIDHEQKITHYMTFFGGGSGEHPAMPIDNDFAILKFLTSEEIFKIEENYKNKKVSCFFESLKNLKINNLEYKYNPLFCKDYWPIETYIDISNSFKELGLKSDLGIEYAMNELFGAIIIENISMDSIEDEEIKEIFLMYKENKNEILKYMNFDRLNKLLSMFEKK